MKILGTIKNEVHKYLFESVETNSGELYSEWKLKKRIYNYKDRRYPTGKVTEGGDIEYWFDAIQPRVNNEMKNLRLDSKYFLFWSKNRLQDFPATYIANCKLNDFMEETGKAEEFSEATEDFSSDGNVLLRKTNDGYEKCDPMNTFITNTLARTVDQTAIVERFYLTQTELRKKDGLYKNVKEVIENCGGTSLTPSAEIVSSGSTKSSPLYEIYRRTGEVDEKTLFEAQEKEGGDENKFVLARIICAGLEKGGKKNNKDEYILFAQEIKGEMSDWFKEAHRGPYKGKWWREGLYELLFDQQTAYNELTNEIMRAIPWDTSAIFRHTDVRTLNNVRHGLERGSLVKSADLQQVQVNARTAEAVNMRNSIIADMDAIANSYEVVRGITPASGTPLGTTQLMNENSNKLFDFLRKKLAIPYRYAYKEFILPELVKDLKGKDIIKLTGSEQWLESFQRMVAESWFNQNLALIGPHTKETREALIEQKIIELKETDPLLKNTKDIWKETIPRIQVTIVGEAYNTAEIETLLQVLPLETDPGRRAYMLDYVLKSKGISVPPPIDPNMQQQAVRASQGGKIEEESTGSPIQEAPVPQEA